MAMNPNQISFSQACENNKDPILEHLITLLIGCQSVLEIGGGTGQHALYFAQSLPYLNWHSSDVASNLDGLARRIVHASLENLPEPIRLDVDHRPWACGRYDAVFTANSLHIMSENSVENLFVEIPDHAECAGAAAHMARLNMGAHSRR